MRPAGEVRQKIFETLRENGAMPLCDLAAKSQVGYAACMATVKNAVRAEKLEIVGHEKRAHCKQWVALYALVEATDEAPAQAPTQALQATLNQWCRPAVAAAV